MLDTGTIICNKYRIDKVIGSGGMSTIYQGMDAAGRVCCIKEAKSDTESVESLKEEAEILSRINHWGVPQFFEAFEWKGYFIMVMEYIQGTTLEDLIEKQGPADEDLVIGWSRQIFEILSYLHSRRQPIIHRDIKPSNIILRQNGRIALLDFGIAREFKTGKLQDTRGLGTKGYAAPEQYGGMGQTDARTDLYSYGATMFYLLTGKNPMDVPQEFPMVRKIKPDVSANMESIIGKATKTRPGERYQNAAEFAAALDATANVPNNWIGAVAISSAIVGSVLVIYEAVIGIPHMPVFIFGSVLILAAAAAFILNGGLRKLTAREETGSKTQGAFLQSRDNFGSGSLSGTGSGRMPSGSINGVIVEDSVSFIATDDWITILGRG